MRDEWKQGRTAVLTQVSLLTIAAFLSHLGSGCSTVDHWGPQSPQFVIWFSRWHPVSDCLKLSGHLVILFSNDHLLLLSFHLFTQVHLLIDSSVEGQNITSRLFLPYNFYRFFPPYNFYLVSSWHILDAKYYSYIQVIYSYWLYQIWLALDLWHIKPFRLFNATVHFMNKFLVYKICRRIVSW